MQSTDIIETWTGVQVSPVEQRYEKTAGSLARVRAPRRPPTKALRGLNCSRSTRASAAWYDFR